MGAPAKIPVWMPFIGFRVPLADVYRTTGLSERSGGRS
jgi:hypothetical protein